MEDLRDKVAVVTGGSSGIGRGMALALAEAGAHVVVADIDAGAAKQVADELSARGQALAVPTDVTRREQVEALAATAKSEFGGVDVLCNNAGVFLGGSIREMTDDDLRFVMSVNVDGAFRVGQVFAELLRRQGRGGHIVNTASIGGFLSSHVTTAYSASKFAMVAYSEALRMDLAGEGIGVSTLCPGPIRTNLSNSDALREAGERSGNDSASLWQYIKDGMEPEDVGPIVVRGILENAAYIFTHDVSADFNARFDAVLADFARVGAGG